MPGHIQPTRSGSISEARTTTILGALALALLLGGEARLGMVDSGAALLTTPVVTVIITHRPLPFVTGSLSLTSASTLKHLH